MTRDYKNDRLLAELVLELQDQPDSGHVMRRAAEAALGAVPGATSVAVSTADKKNLLRNAASTSETARAGDDLQAELGEGPCVEATWETPHVVSSDLTAERRWPRWSARVASDLGVRSMLCVRLSTHHERIGALNLYSEQPDAFDDDDVDVVLSLAAHLSVAISRAAAVEQLSAALDSRTCIAQAVGLIMERHHLAGDAAFAVLSRMSSHQNRKLSLIAQELVAAHDRKATSEGRLQDIIVPERSAPRPRPPRAT